MVLIGNKPAPGDHKSNYKYHIIMNTLKISVKFSSPMFPTYLNKISFGGKRWSCLKGSKSNLADDSKMFILSIIKITYILISIHLTILGNLFQNNVKLYGKI